MNDFDHAARFAARHLDIVGFFRFLLGPAFVSAWRFADWLDTQAVPLPGEPDLRCDTVAGFDRVANDHRPMMVVVEFMSRTRRISLHRLTRYVLQVQADCPNQRDPRVDYAFGGVLVNLTGGAQPPTLIDQPPDAVGMGLSAAFVVRTLAEESADALLADVIAGQQSRSVLAWAPLMAGAETADFVMRWRAEVERETDERLLRNMIALAKVFSDLSGRHGVWRKGLEGMQDERSQTALEWEARGEERGEQRTRRSVLIDTIEARFGSLPAEVRQIIETQDDVATLRSWQRIALTAASADAFRDAITQ